jgi:hypothetical protein
LSNDQLNRTFKDFCLSFQPTDETSRQSTLEKKLKISLFERRFSWEVRLNKREQGRILMSRQIIHRSEKMGEFLKIRLAPRTSSIITVGAGQVFGLDKNRPSRTTENKRNR